MVIPKGQGIDRYLVAWVVSSEQMASEELRQFLRSQLPEYMVPMVIRVVTELPLLRSGKVDRKALSEMEVGQAARAEIFVGPRTPTEQAVADLWAKMMGTDSVSVHEDFFNLAGHSLLATQLVWRLRQRFKVDLPLRAVFEFPTVAALSLCLDQLMQESNQQTPPSVSQNRPNIARSPKQADLLVALQPKGDQVPLFCMAPLGYSPLSYRALAQRLGERQPLYVLQPLAELQRPDSSEFTLEEIAAEYLRAIRQTQSQGPYQLAGWSSGGLAAFEVGRQLDGAGEQVATIALFDSWAPESRQAVREIDDVELLVDIATMAVQDKGASIEPAKGCAAGALTRGAAPTRRECDSKGCARQHRARSGLVA